MPLQKVGRPARKHIYAGAEQQRHARILSATLRSLPLCLAVSSSCAPALADPISGVPSAASPACGPTVWPHFLLPMGTSPVKGQATARAPPTPFSRFPFLTFLGDELSGSVARFRTRPPLGVVRNALSCLTRGEGTGVTSEGDMPASTAEC